MTTYVTLVRAEVAYQMVAEAYANSHRWKASVVADYVAMRPTVINAFVDEAVHVVPGLSAREIHRLMGQFEDREGRPPLGGEARQAWSDRLAAELVAVLHDRLREESERSDWVVLEGRRS